MSLTDVLCSAFLRRDIMGGRAFHEVLRTGNPVNSNRKRGVK